MYSSTSCQLELADAEEAVVTSAASIIAAQAPIASARRRKDPMAVLLLCLFVLQGFRSVRDPAFTATGLFGRGTVWLPDPGARGYRDAPPAASRRDDRMVGRG